jgi:hypothetical protein
VGRLLQQVGLQLQRLVQHPEQQRLVQLAEQQLVRRQLVQQRLVEHPEQQRLVQQLAKQQLAEQQLAEQQRQLRQQRQLDLEVTQGSKGRRAVPVGAVRFLL